MKRILITLALLCAWPVAANTPPGALPGAEAMAPHRAVYRLVLDSARSQGGVQNVDGAMIYEVVDACDGWATRQRMTMTLRERDGISVEMNTDYSTFESKDGRTLRFSMTQITEGAVTQRVSGEATLAAGGGRVVYQDPAPHEIALPPGTLFPMAHTLRVLAAARAGERIVVVPVLDGSTEDGAQDTTTLVLGGWQQPPAQAPHALLAGLGFARMKIAFFEPGQPQDGAATPAYEVALRYWQNGIADELLMNFGDFSVRGSMVELQPLAGGC
jgi:hypothetical protein